MSDTINQFARKSFLNKFDCSQAYLFVQMADDKSIQFLLFNYLSQTHAFKCLAQGLAKSVTGFSVFVRNYLYPCLAAGTCTQFMDDTGVEKFVELVSKLRKIFNCIRKSGLKFAPPNLASKCHIGTEKKIKILEKCDDYRRHPPKVCKNSEVFENHKNAKNFKAR